MFSGARGLRTWPPPARELLRVALRAAPRAGFGDGHVGGGEVAIRVARAAIENARASTAAFPGAAAADKFAFLAFRARDAHGDGSRVLALRVGRATDEFAEASVLFHQPAAARGALLVERFIRLVRDTRPLHQAARRLAVGIARASQEGAESPALDGHFLPAVVAILDLVGVPGVGLHRREILNEVAVGIARAAQEKPVAANAGRKWPS